MTENISMLLFYSILFYSQKSRFIRMNSKIYGTTITIIITAVIILFFPPPLARPITQLKLR